MTQRAPSDRTRVRRLPQRADYAPETVAAILDEGLVAHVAFVVDGRPFVIPTTYVRIDQQLFIHGSVKSRILAGAGAKIPLCVGVTLVDGVVLARSAFHHSVNYRSVVVFGEAQLIEDENEKRAVLTRLVERFVPGRSRAVRAPSEKELKVTGVLSLPLAEASAKVRSEPPLDDAEDLGLPCWAGVLPLRVSIGDPVPASGVPEGAEVPEVSGALFPMQC
jgi:nitroimidazol reductase NimA-like FMN-containing flavoprotein (pyridoxamine 5'-phosphate oxidase superfamily)